MLSTTSWRPRFLRSLKIWSGIALCCLVVALLPFSELNERGRLVTGLAFAWKVESNGLDPQLVIDLANQCYIVLRAPGFEVPLLALWAADYRHIVGDFKSSTISHGFPSQKEARVYCEAAGVRFPDRPWQLPQSRR